MVIITDAKGNLLSPTITENVYQGSNNANDIVFLSPLPQTNEAYISFRLPNGQTIAPKLMTAYEDVPNNEYDLSAWIISLTEDVTYYYGQVQFQIKVVNTQGQRVATVSGTFPVIRGVQAINPPEPSETIWEQILTALAGINETIGNGDLTSKGILSYDATFSYPFGATVYDSDTNALYTSLSANNEGNALSNATYWKKQEFIHYLSTATVTLDEVKSIFNNGGLPVLVEPATSISTPDKMYFLTSLSNVIAKFTSIDSPYVYWYSIFSGSKQKLSAKIITTNSVDQQLNAYSTWTVPSTKCVYDALETKQDTLTTAQQNAVNSGITSELVAQISENEDNITAINSKIPTQASSSNQLADKDFVGDAINSLTAFYITRNAQGDPFETKAQLNSATTYYSGGEVRVPTRNDYCYVLADETHDNATTRYSYQNGQWEFQVVVNETPLTTAQLNALNSGITASLVEKIGSSVLTTTAQNLSGAVNELNSNKQSVSNLVTSIDANSTDTQYPSAKCVFDIVGDINSLLQTLNTGTGVEDINTVLGTINDGTGV